MYDEDFVEHLHKSHLANSNNEVSFRVAIAVIIYFSSCNVIRVNIVILLVQIGKMLYLWMLEPQERDAVLAKDAIESRTTDYKALVEIYTRQNINQLFFTKQAYVAKFKRHLDQDILSEPSYSYEKVGFIQL